MSFAKGMRCLACGRALPLQPIHVCPDCLGPVELEYDYEAVAAATSPDQVARGPQSLWRYRALLPVEDGPLVDLGTGFTPLLRADNLGRELGLRHLYLKNDAVNPTASYKDRVVAVAATAARQFGFTTLACASTGNLAMSVAAHAAKMGLPSYVFVPADLEPGKIVGTAVFGTRVVAVRGDYDKVNRLCSELADQFGWAFVNINLRPYYSEGSKTLSYETAEQLGWRAPDHVVIPIAGGQVITKLTRGFEELKRLGWIEGPVPRVSGAQARGADPVARAYKAGDERVAPIRVRTIASSLAIGNPADGEFALRAARSTGGVIDEADDAEILDAIRLLATTEGIFTEPAGGVTVAVARKLAAQGVIRPDEVVVLYITGNGLKTVDVIADHLPDRILIDPNPASFEEAMAGVVA